LKREASEDVKEHGAPPFLSVGPYQATDIEIASVGLEPTQFKTWLYAAQPEDDWLEVLEQYFRRVPQGLTGESVREDFILLGLTLVASQAASAVSARRSMAAWSHNVGPCKLSRNASCMPGTKVSP